MMRAVRAWLAAAALCLMCASALPARAAGGDGAGYLRALEAAASALDSASRAPAAKAGVPQVHVPPAPLPGPPRFSPSLDDWLQGGLTQARTERDAKQRVKELKALAATLRAVEAEAGGDQTHGAPRLDAAQTARAILADPAYRDTQTQSVKPEKTWWDRFVEWFANLFDRIFSGLYGAANASPLFGRVLAIVLLAAFGALLGVIGYRLARAFLGRRRRAAAAEIGEAIDTLPDPSGLYGMARVAARHGEFGRAIALIFRASLMLLDRSGRVPYDAARTAGQYRGEVQRHFAPAASSFDNLARSFTVATYASRPATDKEWSDAEAAYSRFEPLAERR
jgi:hypothetical protein